MTRVYVQGREKMSTGDGETWCLNTLDPIHRHCNIHSTRLCPFAAVIYFTVPLDMSINMTFVFSRKKKYNYETLNYSE